MSKTTRMRVAILTLGCLVAVGAGVAAYFIRSARSNVSEPSPTGVLMMIAVGALVLVAASAGRR